MLIKLTGLRWIELGCVSWLVFNMVGQGDCVKSVCIKVNWCKLIELSWVVLVYLGLG